MCTLSKQGGGINTEVTSTRRKPGGMLGVYFSLSILFSSDTSSQSAVLGIHAGPPGSGQMQGVGGSERPPKAPATHCTRVPSGSSPEDPGTCFRNWVPPSVLGPHYEGAGPQVSSPL